MSEVDIARRVAVKMCARIGSRVKLNDGSIWTITVDVKQGYWLISSTDGSSTIMSQNGTPVSSGRYIVEVLS